MTLWIALAALAAITLGGYLRWSDAFYGYWPRVEHSPSSRVDYQRIAELEYEMGISTVRPPPRRPDRNGAYTLGDWHQHRQHFIDKHQIERETRQQIEAAGYEAIDITQFGDPEPRYIPGMRSR